MNAIEHRIRELRARYPKHYVALAHNRQGEQFIARWCKVQQRYGSRLEKVRTIRRLLAAEPVGPVSENRA